MKKSRLQQTSIEVTVGAFMIMILLALGFFTIILSRENIFMRNYHYKVIFEDVTGLTKGDKVYVHGVDVGRVKDMRITKDGVQVLLTLKFNVVLRKDYLISVRPSSVLGGRYVYINPGSETEPVLGANEIIRGEVPVDFIAEAADAIRSMRKSLEEGGVLGNLENSMANVKNITDGLANGEGTIGKLLKDDGVYNDLKSVASSLRELTDKVNAGDGTLGRLVNDNDVYTNLQAIAANLKDVSERLAQGKGTLGKLMSEDDTLYKDLSASAASIRDISDTISKGEGTIGRLAKDDEIYNNLNKLLVEIRAVIDDLRETSPITSFSSVFFGAF